MIQKVTIAEVAKRAEMSVGTVSGVLNRRQGHSPETIAKVRSVVLETGFKPRRYKGRKVTSRLHQFAFLYPEPRVTKHGMVTYLGMTLARGADEVFAEQGNQLIVTQLQPGGRMPLCIKKHQVEGVLVRAGDYPDNLVGQLKGVPAVWVIGNRPPPVEMDFVGVDNLRLGRLAAEQLLRLQPKRVLLIETEQQFNLELRIRSQACEDVLSFKSVKVQRVHHADLAAALSSNERGLTALFVPGHDDDVQRVSQLLSEASAGVRRKTRIVSVVTDPHLQRLDSLSSSMVVLTIDPLEIGRAAARQLLWRREHPHESARTVLISPRIAG